MTQAEQVSRECTPSARASLRAGALLLLLGALASVLVWWFAFALWVLASSGLVAMLLGGIGYVRARRGAPVLWIERYAHHLSLGWLATAAISFGLVAPGRTTPPSP